MNGPRRWMAFMAASVLLCRGVTGDTSTTPSAPLSSTHVSALTASVSPAGAPVSPSVAKTTDLPDPAINTLPSATKPDTSVQQAVSTSANDMPPVEPAQSTGSDLESATSTQAAEASKDIVIKQTSMTLTEQKNPVQSEPVLQEDHTCVDKDSMKDRSAVILTLDTMKTCDQFKVMLDNIGPELCNSCKFNIFQENNIIIAGGKQIEADPAGMAEKFSSENVKRQLNVVEAKPLWGKTPPTVLVSLLLIGLLLAALLIAGYCLKDRWIGRAKGKRLAAEPCQTHEDNECQSVSVTPLNPSEAQEKPTINGESPDGGKNQPAPATTNGHSAAKSAVADTEL